MPHDYAALFPCVFAVLAMTQAGLHVRPRWRIESDFSAEGGYRAGAALFEGARPSAVFAANDMLGMGLLRAAAERGVAIPRELSAIGFDDIQMCRYVYPALTTVGQSITQLGEVAAERLLQRIQGKAVGGPRRHVLVPRVIQRQSTACVATGATAPGLFEEQANL